MKRISRKFKDSRAYRIFKMVMDSASIAMIVSVVFFVYEISEGKRETKEVVDNLIQIQRSLETDEVVDNLIQIQNSLSTRYLGTFPEYISNINRVLDDALLSHKPSSLSDSVIIFEDVLYYGIRSDAEGFRKMYQNILYLAENGFHVTIAYYNPLGTPFEQMVKDALIDVKYQNVQQRDIKKHYADVKLINDFLKEIDHAPSSVEYKNTLIKLADNNFQSLYDNDYVPKETSERKLKRINRLREDYTYVDSIFSERYFDSTKITQKVKIEKMMKGYQALIPLGKDTNDIVTIKVNEMCSQLQVAMSKYMSVGINEITYSDFKKMYAEMTDIIISLLKTNPNIELLPLEERLLMSCWLTKVGEYEQAVLAFPSKYTTEEIGFVSQDDAFAKYIHTMMNGIKNNMIK